MTVAKQKTEAGSTAVATPRKQREKSRYVLEQLFDETAIKEDVDTSGEIWERYPSSPNGDFDDTASALDWAQAQNLSGKFRVVVVKAVVELETETVKKTVIKPVAT